MTHPTNAYCKPSEDIAATEARLREVMERLQRAVEEPSIERSACSGEKAALDRHPLSNLVSDPTVGNPGARLRRQL